VAELLIQAAEAPISRPQEPITDAKTQDGKSPPIAGVVRDTRAADSPDGKSAKSGKTPLIVDVESGSGQIDSQSENNPSDEDDSDKPTAGRLSLPGTAVLGGGAKQPQAGEACPARERLTQATEEQEDLLAEFAKVAEELKKILANLEGSTFVKRLKAASRRQLDVADDLNKALVSSFGVRASKLEKETRGVAAEVAQREVAYGDDVYVIQEDLEAYYNRVREGKFKTVLNEMRTTQVVSNIHRIAGIVEVNLNGRSIALAEYWADALDRWAEQLVGPG
jgi:hypothetical protein